MYNVHRACIQWRWKLWVNYVYPPWYQRISPGYIPWISLCIFSAYCVREYKNVFRDTIINKQNKAFTNNIFLQWKQLISFLFFIDKLWQATHLHPKNIFHPQSEINNFHNICKRLGEISQIKMLNQIKKIKNHITWTLNLLYYKVI